MKNGDVGHDAAAVARTDGIPEVMATSPRDGANGAERLVLRAAAHSRNRQPDRISVRCATKACEANDFSCHRRRGCGGAAHAGTLVVRLRLTNEWSRHELAHDRAGLIRGR
jgi:hypothetical protein